MGMIGFGIWVALILFHLGVIYWNEVHPIRYFSYILYHGWYFQILRDDHYRCWLCFLSDACIASFSARTVRLQYELPAAQWRMQLASVTASIPLSEPFDGLRRSLRWIESDSVRVCNTPGYFGVAVGVSTVVTVSMFCEPEPPECSVVRKLVGA